ncbi:beta-hexosaminidase [Ihubacter massiliensis]|uniref:beta-N-acetylhexosaminidase n=1 Tax=Hominibacterium faecale TaxID=2839743 RepID=A0A9J6QRK6_9FIRM|nr:glycoside hydrolase family 3 N-terminal domain-containing protein [Hominibacterium faecale]MCI7304298.1 beta-hexosaminidase [Clostridia bacterium]MCO7122858.1 beta-hexosaminidase [Ihubacter massiliensis]MCU7377131.1 beta-hexosaminidase [Hominibacterium faecale]MDY3010960.1 glycoside hydrolase family 3 N-terminal domain-containing protein [Clostridiales Family XIII bacterium]
MRKRIIAVAAFVILAGAGLFLVPGMLGAASDDSVPAEQQSSAAKILKSMTLEEKVGQMFLVCVSSSTASKDDIAAYHPGGYLFFADFFKSRDWDSAKEAIASYQKASAIPMLMAVDEEGGTVVRVSKFPAYRPAPFDAPGDIYQRGGLEGLRADAREKSDLLLSLGINVNLAPVCDMTEDKEDFIYPRTLGQDKGKTADYVSAVVEEMNAKKIGSALKHFPGYGGNADTHTGIAVDHRSYEAFVSGDFLPFEAGIAAGAPCVLMSHNIVSCMDADKPASLSQNVHNILRKELAFDKVILTDDLSMEGVQGYCGGDNIAVAAVNAGNDLLCTADYKEQIPAVCQAVKSGKISMEQIDQSVLRVLQWKEDLGLLDDI